MKDIILALSAIASIHVHAANVYGTYAQPLDQTPPSSYSYHAGMPYDEDAVRKITALHDMMCERADICRADWYPSGDRRQLVLDGCPSPAVRNALGEHAAASNFVMKVDMENLYRAFRTFMTTRHDFANPEPYGNETYPTYTSPLGYYEYTIFHPQISGHTQEIGWKNPLNGCAGNLDLTSYFGAGTPYHGSGVSDSLRTLLEREGITLSEYDDDNLDYGYRNERASEHGMIGFVTLREEEWSFMNFCANGKYMSWKILNNMREFLEEQSGNCFYFSPARLGLKRGTRTTTRQIRHVGYDQQAIKSWVASQATCGYTDSAAFDVSNSRTEDTEPQTVGATASEIRCVRTNTRTRNHGWFGARIYGRVVWTDGPWETVGTRQVAHGTVTISRKHCTVSDVQVTNVLPVGTVPGYDLTCTTEITDVTSESTLYSCNKNLGEYVRADASRVNAIQQVVTRKVLRVEQDETSETNMTVAAVNFDSPDITLKVCKGCEKLVTGESFEPSDWFDYTTEPVQVSIRGLDLEDLRNKDYYVYKSRFTPDPNDPDAEEEHDDYWSDTYPHGHGPSTEEHNPPPPGDFDGNGRPKHDDYRHEYDHDPQGGGDATWYVGASVDFPAADQHPTTETIEKTCKDPCIIGINCFRFLGM